MKNRPLRVLFIAAGLFAALAAALYFVHPMAPLLLLASLVVQLPIIAGLTRAGLASGYRERAAARRRRYDEDGDAGAWLAGEEAEAAAPGYRFWSSAARAQCALSRAEAMAALGRGNEAAALLAELPEDRLPETERARFEAVVETIRAGDEGAE